VLERPFQNPPSLPASFSGTTAENNNNSDLNERNPLFVWDIVQNARSSEKPVRAPFRLIELINAELGFINSGWIPPKIGFVNFGSFNDLDSVRLSIIRNIVV